MNEKVSEREGERGYAWTWIRKLRMRFDAIIPDFMQSVLLNPTPGSLSQRKSISCNYFRLRRALFAVRSTK